MATISFNKRSNNLQSQTYDHHAVVVEEIGGLIRVHKNGRVERPSVVPHARCAAPSEFRITVKDVTIDEFTNLWARVYVPNNRPPSSKLPLLVYFHGGGFCVGSASWSCYHDFLLNLSRHACCIVVSVNYRLAPEHRLPAAYDDGINTILWLKQNGTTNELKWCDFSSLYLAGDSAGANIAHQVAARLGSRAILSLKGTILIQPFFGGESRTMSEKHSAQPPDSALSLAASDTYWRLSLPMGASRDHPWCNPLARGAPSLSDLSLPRIMVCVSELDILKDRNLEFSRAMARAGKLVQTIVYKDVGHAFQVLNNYPMSQSRTHEMMSHLKAFINQ